jgi:hypothetical protein
MLTAAGGAVAINPDSSLRRLARERGWEVHDFRTGRRAARYALPMAAALAISVGYAYHRRRR